MEKYPFKKNRRIFCYLTSGVANGVAPDVK